jgi:hypothetical protein
VSLHDYVIFLYGMLGGGLLCVLLAWAFVGLYLYLYRPPAGEAQPYQPQPDTTLLRGRPRGSVNK